jgi:hypothetical protein
MRNCRLACLSALLLCSARAFHDCVQPARGRRLPPGFGGEVATAPPPANCSGGLCVGMHNGPHEGGSAAYPVGDAATGFTSVYSTMTVPALPRKSDGICYYIWTDIFFGDMSQGRMNQFVPQLILGNALDGSSGAPAYKPHWGEHKTWQFGAHYFFETASNASASAALDGHAAYGEMFGAAAGETLFTSFRQSAGARDGVDGPVWTLQMGVVGDASRLSTVVAAQPYMGLGAAWDEPTTSWAELNYTNMCVNACWELYGADDRDHLPSSGSAYDVRIERPAGHASFPWVTQWDEDEGAGKSCASSAIKESHNDTVQRVQWDISL